MVREQPKTTSASRRAGARPAPKVDVLGSSTVIRVSDPQLFGERIADLGIEFLRRVFALSEVACVEVDRDRNTAWIRRSGDRAGLVDFLARLAGTLRRSAAAPPVLGEDRGLQWDLVSSTGRVKIGRVGGIVTTWEKVASGPGKICLRHPSLRGDGAAARRIETALHHLTGVVDCKVMPAAATVTVRFDPGLTDPSRVLFSVDSARRGGGRAAHDAAATPAGSAGLVNASLALATAGELVFPPLLPVCAVLLVGSNIKTFGAAWRQLRQRKLGLPVLYAGIVAATLASGQFIASAAMSWMLVFWRRRYQAELADARYRLLGELVDGPQYARLATQKQGSLDVELRVDDLRPGDVIVIRAGEAIPVDGQVLEGHALADERLVTGAEGMVRKGPGDLVFAGGVVRAGELRVAVVCRGHETRSALWARAIRSALAPPNRVHAPTPHGEAFAEQTVPSAVAMAGLGLLVGDVSTAGAILRPDYATGPGMAFPLETIQAIALCLRHGVVVRDPEAIGQLATADMVVFDDIPALWQTELEVEAVEVFPDCSEHRVLAYAAAAFSDLDDERASALQAACHARGITPSDLPRVEFAPDVTLQDEHDRIKVGDLGARARRQVPPRNQDAGSCADKAPVQSLMVGINGRVAGLVHFRRSERPEIAPALERLRARGKLQLGIVSDRPLATVARLADSLGADFHLADQSADDRIRFLRHCRRRGYRVLYIGDCRALPDAAALAHVAISVIGDRTYDLDSDPAPILLLQPRLAKLGPLCDVASIHHRRLKVAHGYALVPNLFCVAGAFAWGFTSLASVLLTNLGTYTIYSRTTASLRTLDRQITRSFGPRARAK